MKAQVVDLLTAMALTMKRQGDAHRARAYMAAARAVARRDDFEQLLAEDRLQSIPGVGPKIDAKIKTFVETGARPDWVEPLELGEDAFPSVPADWEGAPFADAPDLHVHSTWSDGTLTIDEIAAFAKLLGAKAVGVSDHSGSLRIARGLDPESVRAQWDDVARVQEAHPELRILKGTECDILRDGTLDHPRDVLEGFDYVIGSLHSHLKLPEAEQTERLLTALDDPLLTIVGHPTTRIPGTRARAHIDLARLFEKAARRAVALEVNGNPGRIDLDVDLARQALAAGCLLSLGSDAHSAHEMLEFTAARRIAAEAGATPERIVNLSLLA